MKQFLIAVGAVVVGGLLFCFLGLFMLMALVGAASAPAPQPQRMVLAVDLREPMSDQQPTNAFAAFGAAPADRCRYYPATRSSAAHRYPTAVTKQPAVPAAVLVWRWHRAAGCGCQRRTPDFETAEQR